MHTPTINLSKLLQPFENKWVALTPDYRNVAASGETLDEVESQLETKELSCVIFFKVPRFDAVFVPTAL